MLFLCTHVNVYSRFVREVECISLLQFLWFAHEYLIYVSREVFGWFLGRTWMYLRYIRKEFPGRCSNDVWIMCEECSVEFPSWKNKHNNEANSCAMTSCCLIMWNESNFCWFFSLSSKRPFMKNLVKPQESIQTCFCSINFTFKSINWFYRGWWSHLSIAFESIYWFINKKQCILPFYVSPRYVNHVTAIILHNTIFFL